MGDDGCRLNSLVVDNHDFFNLSIPTELGLKVRFTRSNAEPKDTKDIGGLDFLRSMTRADGGSGDDGPITMTRRTVSSPSRGDRATRATPIGNRRAEIEETIDRGSD